MEKTKKSEQKTNASLGYAGSVVVQLVRGKKVVKTIKTHNSGRLPLFLFLANALIGRLDTRGTPRFILLGYTEGDDSGANQISTNAIPYSSASIETVTTGGNVAASAIFKFLIPFSSLTIGQEANVIRLYSQNSLGWDNHIASFILPTEDEEGNPIDPIVSDGKSNILITWTMKITNQQEEVV
jgi:hypothetical protein